MSMHHPVQFRCGLTMSNPFILAPLTNTQCQSNGHLSDEEIRWLTMRAKGGFGMVMTCAAFVEANGQGFPNQMSMCADVNGQRHKAMTDQIREMGALSVVQLHHGGSRSPEELIGGTPITPNNQVLTGVHAIRLAFISAAQRAQEFGYDGVQVHGAHGYLLAQFLSPTLNSRTDEYGGSLENRFRLIQEIVDGIRTVCGPQFLLSLRLSPERFGMELEEVLQVADWLHQQQSVDLLDWSLWDVDKSVDNRRLLDVVSCQNRGDTRITVAGKIDSSSKCRDVLELSDAVSIGRGAILHHDFPIRAMNAADFRARSLPVTTECLQNEGVSTNFVHYMRRWDGFVQESDSE